MPDITAATINTLRQKTQAGLMDCKKALVATDGDEAAAMDWLREKGLAKAAKLGDREMGEGRIFIAAGEGKAAVVKISCETDFVAKNDDFAAMGEKTAAAALENGDAARAEIEEMIAATAGKLGENMTLQALEIIDGPVVGAYIHGAGKLAAVAVLDGGSAETARDVAMHVTAMSPAVVRPDEISDELVAKEKEFWKKDVEGKPEQIVAGILAGKEKKFREEGALLTQPFVKNPDQKVSEVVAPATVVAFSRFSV